MENIKIGDYFLNQFNDSTKEKFKIKFNEDRKRFERISHDLAHNHYFDDYCLSTINWFIKMKNQEIDSWITQRNYADTMYKEFDFRRNLFEKEAGLFIKLFENLQFKLDFLTESQSDKLHSQMVENCRMAKEYI